MATRKENKAQRAQLEASVGRDMADDLNFRFKATEDRIRAAAWLLSFATLPDARLAAFLEGAGLKWARTQFGSDSLVPAAWPDRVYNIDGKYYAVENGTCGAILSLDGVAQGVQS